MIKLHPDNHERSGKDDWSKHWRTYADVASKNPAQEMRHDIVLKNLFKLPEKPVLLLDIGSGQGDFLRKAVECNIAQKCVGFELSESGVGISRNKVPQAEFIQVDLFSPPEAVLKFVGQADVAVCSDVIEHVDEPEKFCRLLKAYLKPGAYLILTVPGGPMSEFDYHIGHRTHYNVGSIIQLLRAAGFNVEKIQLAGFPFFNLYRMMVILRGKRLITDVEIHKKSFVSGVISRMVMLIFRALFRLNFDNSRFGWQVVAVARRPI